MDNKNHFQKNNQIFFRKNNINNQETFYNGFNRFKFGKYNELKFNKIYDMVRTERIIKKLLYD